MIFSRERNRKIGTTFFLFSQYDLREATLYGISVSFLRETTISVSYFYGNVNKKSELLRSLIKERAFINSSAATRKSKQKLINVKQDSLLFTLKDYGKFVDNKKKIQMFSVIRPKEKYVLFPITSPKIFFIKTFLYRKSLKKFLKRSKNRL